LLFAARFDMAINSAWSVVAFANNLSSPSLLNPIVFGVGQFGEAPPPLASVWSSSIGSGNNRPPTVIPQRGKFSDDNSGVSVRNDAWHVFQQHESRS
jgi:hypothetical protein